MSQLIGAIVSLLFGVTSLFPTQTSTPGVPNRATGSQTVCLNQELVRQGIDPVETRVPKTLAGIKKPTRSNVTQGYEIEQCIGKGECAGPDVANYSLVAKNINIEHTIFPNSFEEGVLLSDRQMVRQTDISDNPITNERYKNRIFRTHCGDWCYTCEPEDVICLDADCLKVTCNTDKPAVELPYKGSFHCNFIFYLQETDEKGNPQIDASGNLVGQNAVDSNIPLDGRLFSVYLRQDAPLPKYIQCNDNRPDNTVLSKVTPFYSFNEFTTDILAYPRYSSVQWEQLKNPLTQDGAFEARNTQILASFTKVDMQENPAGLSGTFDVYKNLLDPEGDFYLYLVSSNTIESMMQGLTTNPPTVQTFSYYLFKEYYAPHPSNRTLKLSTFPFSNDWVRKWVYESKPAIYIYPETYQQSVTVKLNPKGNLAVSDPIYNPERGWNFSVLPNGTISVGSNSYPYLFYEANLKYSPNPKTGFTIPKEQLETFFRSSLSILGLSKTEIADYLEYWMPRLLSIDEPYLFVYFLSPHEIEYIEPISINIPVTTTIRLRTYFKPLLHPLPLPIQELKKGVVRAGTTVVEWGGILDTP